MMNNGGGGFVYSVILFALKSLCRLTQFYRLSASFFNKPEAALTHDTYWMSTGPLLQSKYQLNLRMTQMSIRMKLRQHTERAMTVA